MRPELEWLNKQIDTMQAGRAVRPRVQGLAYEPNSGDVAILRFAVRLISTRPDVSRIDPDFRAALRSELLAASAGGPGGPGTPPLIHS